MPKLGFAFTAVVALGLPLVAPACNRSTDSEAQADKSDQRSLEVTTPRRADVNTDPNAHKALLAPVSALSDAELQQRAFDSREMGFRKSWTDGVPDYVVEGTVISADATVIPNVTQHGKSQLIATHYRVTPVSFWGKRLRSEPDFWVLGGALAPEIADAAGVPRASRFSHEAYPEVGDKILVAVKLLPFPSGVPVPRPVWNGESVLVTNGSSTLPDDVTARARESLNAKFAN
jgi:hypothetical protein